VTKVLVLGATGMMGNTIFRVFAADAALETLGTVRTERDLPRLPASLRHRLAAGVEATQFTTIERLLDDFRPEVVVNAIGVVKQLAAAADPLVTIPLNAVLPHRLARACDAIGARLIHLSTDCVFDGRGTMYREGDFASADDLYGRSKYLGEVDYPNATTLRTSTIGHELGSHHGLLEWFLAQSERVRGFRKAIYSGLSTREFARVILDQVIPRPELHGLFQVSGDVINKYDLLLLIRDIYGKQIAVDADDAVAIDRSLDSSRFRGITGYAPPPWVDQIREMRDFG
jgi:dTDP-4-dehydrorhamnose reductase